jgi:hypothetical protein
MAVVTCSHCCRGDYWARKAAGRIGKWQDDLSGLETGRKSGDYGRTTALTRTGNSAALHCQPVMRSVCIKGENGEHMDPDKMMDGLSKELNSALKAMAKAKDVNEKEVYSRIVKNLCESLGVFFNLVSEMISFDSDDDLEKEDIPF